MLNELIEAQKILEPLLEKAEKYKAAKGSKAGTLLSKVRNAYQRTSEAIATIESVQAESAALDARASIDTLTAAKTSSK